jgi:hypothetical protein
MGKRVLFCLVNPSEGALLPIPNITQKKKE